MFLGIVLGGVIYISTISKIFIKTNVKIIEFLKIFVINIFRIIIFPIKFMLKYLRKLFFRPISFFFINFKKIFTNIVEKFSQNNRKNKVKKGF